MTIANKTVLDSSLVSGPSSSINNRIAVFDGITGKTIKDSGQTIAEITPEIASEAEALAGNVNDKFMTPLRDNQVLSQMIQRIAVFTTSGTFTPHPDMLFCDVELVGGGGGSGGISGTSFLTASSGAGGGGYARRLLTKVQIGSSQTVTIGAGGSAGVGAVSAGGPGGATSLGTLVVANGGSSSGNAQAPGNVDPPGAGGLGTVGDILIPGSRGGGGSVQSGSTQAFYTGRGGASYLSGESAVSSGNSAGTAGLQYGGGASGAADAGTSTNRNGASGASGVVIIRQFCLK